MRKIFTPLTIAWFVVLTIAILTIYSFCASAHCYSVPTYKKIYPASGSVSTTYTDSSIQFNLSGTTTFTSASNFVGWKTYYFNGNVRFALPINFPSGAGNIRLYGDTKAINVSMNGRDTIRADGGTFDISSLTSNNSKAGQYNVIYTNSFVTIAGKKYIPGETYYSTKDNKETAVLITDCAGTSLPIKLLQFSVQVTKDTMLDVSWMLADKDLAAELQYSSDGSNWETVYQGHYPFFTITTTNHLNFVRLKADNEYSNTIMRVIEKKPITHGIYDVLGRQLNYIPEVPGTYIIR